MKNLCSFSYEELNDLKNVSYNKILQYIYIFITKKVNDIKKEKFMCQRYGQKENLKNIGEDNRRMSFKNIFFHTCVLNIDHWDHQCRKVQQLLNLDETYTTLVSYL